MIDRVVREQRVHCLDLAALPACCEASTWSIDRLHPSARGHRLLARAFVDLLHTAGHPINRPDPVDEADGRLPSRVDQAAWLVRERLPWLLRRSRDLLPLALAAAVRPVVARCRYGGWNASDTVVIAPLPEASSSTWVGPGPGAPAWVIEDRRGRTASGGR